METKRSRVAVITGSSSGIGLATAERLADEGYIVYGISRRHFESEKFLNLEGDVNDEGRMAELLSQIYSTQGRIDVLINNAGFGIAGAIADTKKENIEKIIATNLTAVISLSSLAIPFLKNSGGGNIINISSVGGIIPLPFQACYSATKSGVEIFSRALAGEVKDDKIKVTCLLLGDTKTGFTKARVIDEKEGSHYNKRMNRSVGKMAEDEQKGKSPDGVAKAISKILRKKHPPLRKTIGGMSKFEVFLTRVTSTRFVNYIVKKIYG